jgi:hypothetical protein
MMPLGQHFGCLDGIFAGEDPAFELAADVTAGDALPSRARKLAQTPPPI